MHVQLMSYIHSKGGTGVGGEGSDLYKFVTKIVVRTQLLWTSVSKGPIVGVYLCSHSKFRQ